MTRSALHSERSDATDRSGWRSPHRLLQMALVLFGAISVLLYPLATVWPSGWAWHDGAPHESHYFMMIVGVYVTLGVFLLYAARNPAAHLTLIWFAIWSSVVHAGIMTVQSLSHPDHTGHLWGDVPALLLGAFLLAVLVRASGLRSPGQAAQQATG